jgi:Holliday junction resolvase RusA-like endonuclease
MKVRYTELIHSQIESLPVYTKQIQIIFTLFPKTRRLTDVSNVCSVVDKFFCDALVKAGKIEDDNYKFLPRVIYQFGEVDKDNPRVEIEIQEI